MVEGTSVIASSGDIHDATYTGGRLGVFLFGQPAVFWSHLVARCVDAQNEALYLDGDGDCVEMSNVSTLGIQER